VDSLTATRSHLKALYEKNDGWCKQAWCTGSEPSDWTFSQCLHKRAALLSKFKFFFLCAAACVSLGLVVIPTGRLINLLIQIWWLLFFFGMYFDQFPYNLHAFVAKAGGFTGSHLAPKNAQLPLRAARCGTVEAKGARGLIRFVHWSKQRPFVDCCCA
jgi:hypothetical protein